MCPHKSKFYQILTQCSGLILIIASYFLISKDNEYENFKYNSKFPTKWLYEDFERSLEENVKKYKVEQLLGIVSK